MKVSRIQIEANARGGYNIVTTYLPAGTTETRTMKHHEKGMQELDT